jgi:hypothetical protein
VRRGQQDAASFLGYDLGLTRGPGGVQVRRGHQVAARFLRYDLGLTRGPGRVQVSRRSAQAAACYLGFAGGLKDYSCTSFTLYLSTIQKERNFEQERI